MVFKCDNCKKNFEVEGYKLERMDPVFGPTWKMMADCPDCKAACDEYRRPKPKKDNAHMPSSQKCSGCPNQKVCSL